MLDDHFFSLTWGVCSGEYVRGGQWIEGKGVDRSSRTRRNKQLRVEYLHELILLFCLKRPIWFFVLIFCVSELIFCISDSCNHSNNSAPPLGASIIHSRCQSSASWVMGGVTFFRFVLLTNGGWFVRVRNLRVKKSVEQPSCVAYLIFWDAQDWWMMAWPVAEISARATAPRKIVGYCSFDRSHL